MSQLYVVATPIGNLGDITVRALDILKSVNTILCEDTRITSRLLQKYEIGKKKLLIYNDLSKTHDRERILNMLLNEGEDIVLVSDAGTPLISDPGQKLINFLRKNNVTITPIPGCSSVTAALSASGLAFDKFLFLGFLPSARVKRVKLFNKFSELGFVFFERSNRVLPTLNEILDSLGDRNITIAREITKIHEQIITDSISSVITYFNENEDKIRGEFVILVEKVEEEEVSDDEIIIKVEKMIKSGMSIKDVSAEISEVYNINKKKIYEMALNLKK